MDKKVEKFKADYAAIKEQIKLIKQKLSEIKKEARPIAKAAHCLYERGDKTMYDESNDNVITPKFNGLSVMMEDLNFWAELADSIQLAIDGTY